MKTKQCTKCGKLKLFSEFYKQKLGKFGLHSHCSQCAVQRSKKYNKTENGINVHRKASRKYSKTKKGRNTDKKYKRTHPWAKTYSHCWNRCNDPKHKGYPRYGGRGIKLKMKIKDFKFLWFRDKAYLMKNPSIDRIDSDGHYEIGNCRYKELKKNTRGKARLK